MPVVKVKRMEFGSKTKVKKKLDSFWWLERNWIKKFINMDHLYFLLEKMYNKPWLIIREGLMDLKELMNGKVRLVEELNDVGNEVAVCFF